MGEQAFEVVEPGLFTTVQDLGRDGYIATGIPPSGAMDEVSLRVGNLLVGNPPGEAGLEMTVIGSKLRFLRECLIAATGADMMATLNGEPLALWQSVMVSEGDLLALGIVREGCRGYLSIAGGVDVPAQLGSKSTYVMGRLGGYRGRAFKAGDILEAGAPREPIKELAGRRLKPELIPSYPSERELRVILGPQDDYVDEMGIATFLGEVYTVSSKADRVGYRFEGPPLTFRQMDKPLEAGSDPSNIVDDGIPVGGMQIPAGLEIICMGRDGVTMGGYAKVACLITADMERMGQLKTNDRVRFREVNHKQAEKALREQLSRAAPDNITG